MARSSHRRAGPDHGGGGQPRPSYDNACVSETEPRDEPQPDVVAETGDPSDPGESARISDQIEGWAKGEGPRTLGSLIERFEEKSFAVIFVVLLGVPALPLPTGGATHVFEIIAMLLALQLIVGRDEVWLPQRWRWLELVGEKESRFVRGLLKVIRFLERFSRPRLAWLFDHRLSNVGFGLVILLLSIAAFVAPPFTGLDTLPSLGAVLVSLAVLLEDVAVLVLGLTLGAAGVVLEVVLGQAALNGAKQIFSVLLGPPPA
jgi:hypothetical protein